MGRGAPFVEAVFFDLYETVITEFDPRGRGRPEPTVAERLGLGEEAFRRSWRARRRGRYTGEYEDHRSVLREICSAAGVDVDEDLLAQLRAERLEAKAAPFIRVAQDVVDALERIRRAGVRTGIISNCSPEEAAAWETSTLRPLFDDAVLSCRVGLAKPDPRIYLLACERLGVHPRASLFAGDGGSDELMGAERVGLTPYRAVWFLSRWPDWDIAESARTSSPYPVLRTPAELADLVAAARDRG